MRNIGFNRSLFLALLLAATAFLSGCATGDVDNTNRSERPWNSPTSWEQAGPMSTVMDQH